MSETEAFHALEEENRLLRERLAALEGEDPPSRTQDNSPEPPQTPEPPPPPPVYYKEPKIGEPPTFDGKASEFHSFLQQAKLYIRMRHMTFPKDKGEFRVSYIISRLRSGPAEWGQALLESGSPLLKDYDAFLAKFTSIYENKERRSQLEDRLARLKQVGSASAYSAEFSSLCAILSINPDNRMGDFRLGLKSGVQDSLALLPAPTTFDDLSVRAVRIDNAQFSSRKFANARQNHPSTSSKSQNQHPPQQQSSNSSRPPPSRPPPVPNYTSNPPSSRPGPSRSSAPYPPLTDEEKERRKREKLCGYCGDPTHAVENCPGVAAKNARKHANDARSKPSSFTSHAVVIAPPTSSADFRAPNSGKSNA